MAISADEFDSWAARLGQDGKPPRQIDLAAASGVPRTTITLQRARNSIKASTVLAISRGYGRNPAEDLAYFKGYETLAWQPKNWGPEVLTMIHPVQLDKELQVRAQLLDDPSPFLEIPARDSLVRWVDRITDSMVRRELAEELNTPRAAFSSALHKRTTSIEIIIGIAKLFNRPPHLGLFAAGHLVADDLGGTQQFNTALVEASSREILTELDMSDKYFKSALEATADDEEIRKNLS